MRILLVHPHDVWSSQEPWTIRILQFAAKLRQLGHETTVAYFPRTDHAHPRARNWRDVPLIPLNRSGDPWTFLCNTVRLIRLGGAVDLFHVQKAFHWAVVPTLLAGWLRGRPVHYDWDDWELEIYRHSAKPPSTLMLWWLELLERWVPQLAQTVSVSSERLRQEALALGVDPERIWWAPVGADTDDLFPQPPSPQLRERWGLNGATVLYLGQLHGGQYVEMVLEAAALVQPRVPSVRFLIVGDGHRRDELERMARELNLSCVKFVGAVAREEVPGYVAAADVCIAAFEANRVTECKSPLKLAEYLACGKAIVASNVGEVPRMLGEAGVLVSPGRADALAEKVVRLLEHPDERDRLGRLARERSVSAFTWSHTARRLAEAYAVSGGGHGR